MMVEHFRVEVLLFDDPDNKEAIEEFDYNNSSFGESGDFLYCFNCRSSFRYSHDTGIGEEIEYVGLRVLNKDGEYEYP